MPIGRVGVFRGRDCVVGSLGGGMVYRLGLVGNLTGGECLNRSIIGAAPLGASEFWFRLWLVILLVCGLFEIR